MKRFLILALMLTISAGALTACQNAWHGAGEDMENLGEKMQDPNQ